MRRFIEKQFSEWKQSPVRKPLIVQGARQVGKTYALKQFGKEQFRNVVYCNFERDKQLSEAFLTSLDPHKILQLLAAYFGEVINPQDTLIIFDEIQECPAALTSLKYFFEEAPEYAVAAAGSLLGVTLAQESSFPVGSVSFLALEPLSLFEYAYAREKGPIIAHLHELGPSEPIPALIAGELTKLLAEYQVIGGMPEAVQTFLSTQSYDKTRVIHEAILKSYVNDFARHAPRDEVAEILAVWDVLPAMLGRENKKFTFSLIRPGARASDFERAIRWLVQAGVVRLCKRVTSPGRPLRSHEDPGAFKLYVNDVGLLAALMNIPSALILSPDKLLGQFSGALAECFVAQELSALGFSSLYYWTSTGEAEIDFILELDEHTAPLEVKAGHNLKSKSLTSYISKYSPGLALRASLQNISRTNGLVNFPLYALPLLQMYAKNLGGAGARWH